jgi:hypothetical protein
MQKHREMINDAAKRLHKLVSTRNAIYRNVLAYLRRQL